MPLSSPTAASRPPSWEDALGPAECRYFAAGYRRVRHEVRAAELSDGSNETTTAIGRVSYPESWSTDAAGAPRRPHLSSVDAIVLPLLTWQNGAVPPHRGDVLRSVRLQVGSTPWMELDRVPIALRASPLGGGATAVSSTVGKMRSTLGFAPGKSPDLGSVLPQATESVYGGLYQAIQCTSRLSALDASNGVLDGEHEARIPNHAHTPADGVESVYWPALTAIDYVVTMGQLTQAVIHATRGQSRATIGSLWMRSMSLTLPPRPAPLPTNFRSSTRLVKHKVLDRGGRRIHDIRVESAATTGAVASATLAYSEQA